MLVSCYFIFIITTRDKLKDTANRGLYELNEFREGVHLPLFLHYLRLHLLHYQVSMPYQQAIKTFLSIKKIYTLILV